MNFGFHKNKDKNVLIGQRTGSFIVKISKTYRKSSIKISTFSYLHNKFYKF